jgi:hypothetical protein
LMCLENEMCVGAHECPKVHKHEKRRRVAKHQKTQKTDP